MRNKKHLKAIKKIIFEENPDLKTNKNDRGQLMFFQNCTYETYVKLDKFLKKLEIEKIEEQTRSITEASERILMSSEMDDGTANAIDYAKARTRLRYSNHEKKLIRRKKYEQIISERFDTENSDKSNSSSNKSSSKSLSKTSKVKKVRKKKSNKKTKKAKASLAIFSKA